MFQNLWVLLATFLIFNTVMIYNGSQLLYELTTGNGPQVNLI